MNSVSTTHPKRVLVVAGNPLGGIRTYMLYNLLPLQASDYRFTFVAPDNEAFERFRHDVRDWPDVEFAASPIRNGRLALTRTVRRELLRTSYALIHSQGLRSGMEACMANVGLRIPHAITLHDVIVPGNDIPGKFKWLKRRAIGWGTSRADMIIPVSHDCAANHLGLFPEWKRGKCRIEVILNGVDVTKLEEASRAVSNQGELRRKLNLADDVLLLGFFGRFMPQKNFLVLLDALTLLAKKQLHDRIHLVAVDDRDGYAHYRDEARRDNLRGMVSLIEPVTNVAEYLCQIDAVVIPSQWEACPLLPMEAMVLNVPVIGSDCIGLREVLTNTPCRIGPAGNAELLAEAIITELSDRTVFQKQSPADSLRTRFDVSNSVRKLADLYGALTKVTTPDSETSCSACEPRIDRQ